MNYEDSLGMGRWAAGTPAPAGSAAPGTSPPGLQRPYGGFGSPLLAPQPHPPPQACLPHRHLPRPPGTPFHALTRPYMSRIVHGPFHLYKPVHFVSQNVATVDACGGCKGISI